MRSRAGGRCAPRPARSRASARTRSSPASVPGVVHLDLLAAGLIPDPYLDDNEALLAWIGLVDWTYEYVARRSPPDDLAGAQRHELVFDGLDTVATVAARRGTCWPRSPTSTAATGSTSPTGCGRASNVLTVAFRSPVRHANAQSVALGARPRPYPMPYEAIRKSACSFGWDWGIATCTSGIWRPVRLESWSTARLDAGARATPSPTARAAGSRATVRVARALARDTDLTVTLDVAGVHGVRRACPAGDERGAPSSLELAAVDRWWPAGHGAQPLYDVRRRRSAPTTRCSTRRPGGSGSARCAGTPSRMRPAPRSSSSSTTGRSSSRASTGSPTTRSRPASTGPATRTGWQQAKAANLNLVRVWGGGIYESDDFYDLCDELGLLTWQDFLFACAAYPEEEPLRVEVEAEARENVDPPRPPRIAGAAHRQQREPLGPRGLGVEGAARRAHVGSALLLRAAPGHRRRARTARALHARQPLQPADGRAPERRVARRRRTSGSTGTPWTGRPTATVRPRFVAEFGWQGPPAWSTLTRAISDDPLTPESPGMIVHQKATDGNVKLAHGPAARTTASRTTWRPGTGPCSSTRPTPSRARSSGSAPWPRTPRGPSSGSSTTAGRSPRGRRSTATDARSRSTSPCSNAFAPRLVDPPAARRRPDRGARSTTPTSHGRARPC